jgi:hypothetical protein
MCTIVLISDQHILFYCFTYLKLNRHFSFLKKYLVSKIAEKKKAVVCHLFFFFSCRIHDYLSYRHKKKRERERQPSSGFLSPCDFNFLLARIHILKREKDTIYSWEKKHTQIYTKMADEGEDEQFDPVSSLIWDKD